MQNILERLEIGEVIIGDGSYANTLEKRGYVKVQKPYLQKNDRRYLMDKLLHGLINVHPSNTDYSLKKKFDQFQI